MRNHSRLLRGLMLSGVLLFLTRATQAEDISGLISTTLTIVENSQLTGDVICAQSGGPCIQFGADHIRLRLNGFTITRTDTEPPTGCVSRTTFPLEDNISTNGHDHVAILGPGGLRDHVATASSSSTATKSR